MDFLSALGGIGKGINDGAEQLRRLDEAEFRKKARARQQQDWELEDKLTKESEAIWEQYRNSRRAPPSQPEAPRANTQSARITNDPYQRYGGDVTAYAIPDRSRELEEFDPRIGPSGTWKPQSLPAPETVRAIDSTIVGKQAPVGIYKDAPLTPEARIAPAANPQANGASKPMALSDVYSKLSELYGPYTKYQPLAESHRNRSIMEGWREQGSGLLGELKNDGVGFIANRVLPDYNANWKNGHFAGVEQIDGKPYVVHRDQSGAPVPFEFGGKPTAAVELTPQNAAILGRDYIRQRAQDALQNFSPEMSLALQQLAQQGQYQQGVLKYHEGDLDFKNKVMGPYYRSLGQAALNRADGTGAGGIKDPKAYAAATQEYNDAMAQYVDADGSTDEGRKRQAQLRKKLELIQIKLSNAAGKPHALPVDKQQITLNDAQKIQLGKLYDSDEWKEAKTAQQQRALALKYNLPPEIVGNNDPVVEALRGMAGNGKDPLAPTQRGIQKKGLEALPNAIPEKIANARKKASEAGWKEFGSGWWGKTINGEDKYARPEEIYNGFADK